MTCGYEGRKEEGRGGVPAVGELTADVLEVVVAHVVDVEDDAVLVLGDLLADVLEELVLLLAGLFGDLGEVEDPRALGLGHLVGCGLRTEEINRKLQCRQEKGVV